MSFEKPCFQHIWYPAPYHSDDQFQCSKWEPWLYTFFPAEDAKAWYSFLQQGSLIGNQLLLKIAEEDAVPFIHALFPHMPELFLNTRPTSEIFLPTLNLYEYVISSGDLSECSHLYPEQRMNMTCLCALTGAIDCLYALLEMGADPNGMDNPDCWNTFRLELTENCHPVTPMDLAILTNEIACQHLLENYGGKTTYELVGDGKTRGNYLLDLEKAYIENKNPTE